MKWLISLTLIGAVIGGIYPGAFIAFVCAAPLQSEISVFMTNFILGISGALVGMMAANAIRARTFRPTDAILPIALGLVCGVIGYLLADWAISNADPPL